MPEARFVLKEPKSEERTLIYLIYNFGGQRLKYSTGEKVHPKFWNSIKQRVKEQNAIPESTEINEILKRIESGVNSAFRRLFLENRDEITLEKLKIALNAELKKDAIKKKKELVGWMIDQIEEMRADKKLGSIQVYNALVKHLIDYEKAKKVKLTFNSIDIIFHQNFKNFLFNDKGLLTNTVGKQLKTLKTFLNIATEHGVNSNLKYLSKKFKGMEERIQHAFLNEEELALLFNLDLSKKPYLERVRDIFIVACYTGLRFSDFTKLSNENLMKVNGRYCCKVYTEKTKEKVVIPIKPIVMEIWQKYNGIFPKAISNQKMNEYIKEVAELAGINENFVVKKTSGINTITIEKPKFMFISTHSARRSFATNAFISGIPPLKIMKLTGHRTESSFMKYINFSQESNAEDLSDSSFFR